MSDRRRDAPARTSPASNELVYERYKDALRRGHVAALHGEVDDAVRAYEEAAAMAPHRPMAHASAGLALARAGRDPEAISHFDAAVQLAPRDEGTRAGRAQALAAVGRRLDAADDLDVVAEVREGDGRLTDALDAASRALELAEARHRRATVRRLVAALAGSELDEPARTALHGAMRMLETGSDDEAVGDEAEPADAPGLDGRDAAAGGGDPEARPGGSVPPGPPPDPSALAAAADAALDSGDGPAALQRLLELAAAHRRAGRIDAALDACYLALSVAPDDVELHLALVAIYEDRGWAVLAAEKRELLVRLAALDGNEDAAEQIARSMTRPG